MRFTVPSSSSEGESDDEYKSSSDSETPDSNDPADIDGAAKEGKQVECLACSETVLDMASVPVACGHHWCTDCVKRRFKLAMNDESMYPPVCCNGSQISLVIAKDFFSTKFVKRYQVKTLEWRTKDRTYCAWRHCGAFIPPSSNLRIGICPQCKFWTCTNCKKPMHEHGEEVVCRYDPDLEAVERTARDNGWKHCYKCNQLVEKLDGCNHMR